MAFDKEEIPLPVFLSGGAVAFDSQARKRLERSAITIAKSRSDGIGSTLAREFRREQRRGENVAATPLGL